MQADIHTLFESDFYRILDFHCHCKDHGTSPVEHSKTFSISYVRKGNFLFNVFRNSLDSFTGCILVSKPDYERTVSHVHTTPDECTIIDFKDEFYFEWIIPYYNRTGFFSNNDLHSTLVRTDTILEFLHFMMMQSLKKPSVSKLQIDHYVIEILENTLGRITDYHPEKKLHSSLKRNHLYTIEEAKAFIAHNFMDDISLNEIAKHCHVSPFHFSRLFKTFTSYAPHRFLLDMRLLNASRLLSETELPVSDVAFTSGFNSIEHFTATFKKNYGVPPNGYRQKQITLSK